MEIKLQIKELKKEKLDWIYGGGGGLGRIVRDSQADKGAEFIDETTGLKWDVKSFESYPNGHTSPKKGAFTVENDMIPLR